MGDRALAEQKDRALQAVDHFRSDKKLKEQAEALALSANKKDKERLQDWIHFFGLYQMSDEAKKLKYKIDVLESKIQNKLAKRKEGYIDPKTSKFVKASILKMRTLMQTSPDEKLRKACFAAREKLAESCLTEYVQLIKLRNQFAQAVGFADFFDYNLHREDKMSKEQLFGLFDEIADKTKGTFLELRKLEKKRPRLRKPWNFGYMMLGNFIEEEDPYFQFEEALDRWGRSFAGLGIDFKGGELTLDLLDREGKYSNGFCHWPKLVHFNAGKRSPGSANFTCNVVAGQVGSGSVGYRTLFHEGGHAAHFLNIEQQDVCLNHEYAPQTAAWSETQSMFIDTIMASYEWKARYAKNADGESYPFVLHERAVRATELLKPSRILSIAMVSAFERDIYELRNVTEENIKKVARKNHQKFTDLSESSLMLLNVPHIYSWESSCSYHGYGLAEIALSQWREYFYKKYGHIVDNSNVGKEMKRVWALGAKEDFMTCVKLATGKKLSTKAIIKELTQSADATLRNTKKIQKVMEGVKPSKKVNLKAAIKMVHGKKTITTNKNGFDKMSDKYGKWVRQMANESN